MRYVDQKRLVIVYIAVLLSAGLIFFRLYTISVSDFGQILPALNHQHTRRLNIAERRGFIFDRHGEIIAGHAAAYKNTLVDPSKIGLGGLGGDNRIGRDAHDVHDGSENFRDIYDAAERLAQASPYLDADEVMQRLRRGVPFVMRTRGSFDNYVAQSYATYRRFYAGSPAVHIIGYLNRDRRGVAGIEAAYNEFLAEMAGSRVTAVWEADALGRSMRGAPVDITDTAKYGYDYTRRAGLALTLDWALQQKIEEIADSSLDRGAIVVTCVQTGGLLASVSRPVFSLDNLAHYIDSDRGEFINRAFSAFTPGSVFKTVTAAAALEINMAHYLAWEHYCTGVIDVFGQVFRCHRRLGHGELDLTAAYANSCNTYFIALGLELGYEIIRGMARNLGVGEFNSLDGLSVSRGNVPEAQNPPPAFTANAAIGQGELLMTPLEAARIFSAIANGGVMPELSLLKAFVTGDNVGGAGVLDASNGASRRALSEPVAAALYEMALAVVESGTGVRAAPSTGVAAGKTSTAESGQFREVLDEDGELVREQIMHSWFSGFFPASAGDDGGDNADSDGGVPLYSITVLAEGGVNDGIRSTEIFREVCERLGERLGR